MSHKPKQNNQHPRWLGGLALFAGALGLLSGSLQYLNGVTALTANVLFPIASIGFTIWAFVMGLRLWRGVPAAG